MIRATFAFIFIVVSVLFSGYARGEVAHPEDTDIVGAVVAGGFSVCFNNDGEVSGPGDCGTPTVYEGWLYIDEFGDWFGGSTYGINGCGTTAVNPVSDATCPLTFSDFASCTNNGYVLVKTTQSGHFWAVKANADCTTIATPELVGLAPCFKTDAFDPVTGCVSVNPTEISVERGYIKLDSSEAPPDSHCLDSTHYGRMVVDSVNRKLYICTTEGWESISTDSIVP